MMRVFAVLPAAALALSLCAGAGIAEPRHGLSVFGEFKYAEDFAHFDYVDPHAPKGGGISLIGWGAVTTFNSLNPYILKGDAAQGMEMTFDTLMAPAQDEPDTAYGLIARTADVADDGRSVTFRLRPEAAFADDSPVTAEDVAFSIAVLKEKGDAIYRQILSDVEPAEVLDEHTVRFTFTGDLVRDLPLTVATLPIFSKEFYAARDFAASTLEPPLGSGPYKVADFKQGRTITYERREDYWAKDLPVNTGRWNFDEITYEYFRDRTAGMEAFKAGAYDLREEFTSKVWATEYDFAAVRDGRVVKEVLPDKTPSGTQGYFLNTRRDTLSDPRVRAALALAFDFEWTNKNIFHGLYQRTESYFENSPMKAQGTPSPEERALLEGLGEAVPPSAFEEVVSPPVSDGTGQDRRLLRRAANLLEEASWTIQNGTRRNEAGEPLKLEFLMFEPSFERVNAPYIKNLKLLGIDARMRIVDPSQYESRTKSFDFDVTVRRYSMRLTPGVELFNYFGSAAAEQDGSLNLSGVSDPAVDALIAKVIGATSRDELNTAARALDRVLRAGHYWVPHWNKASHTIAWWNKFSRPETKPLYDRGFLDTWWYDEEKARKLAGGN